MEKSINQSLLSIGPCKNVLFLGGGELLRNLNLWCADNGFNVRVVTSTRHAEEQIEGIKLSDFLTKNEIGHHITDQVSSESAISFFGDLTETFCLSLGAAWLFKQEFIDSMFGGYLFNLHGTRLPQNRGGGGATWQILTSNRFGFCALHLIDAGVDTGDLIQVKEFLYPVSCRTPLDYHNFYIDQNFIFITHFLCDLKKFVKKLQPVGQLEYLSTYWPRLNTLKNGWINWAWGVNETDRFICAFDDPYEGAQTKLNGQRVHLKKSSINLQDGVFHSFQSGLVYRKGQHWLCIAISGGGLIVEEIYNEKGDDIFDSVRVGDRFFTSIADLESTKERIVYTPKGLKN
jgi:methionyl-tRNA formyltransferase